MGFKDAPWGQRLALMGDQAEKMFEDIYPKGKARYGLRRPPIRVDKLPARIRYTPDYLTSDHLYEVMGVGEDQTLKIKVAKLMTLRLWDGDMPTRLWLWDSHNERHCSLNVDVLTEQVGELGKLSHFPEGKPYWGINVNELEASWAKSP